MSEFEPELEEYINSVPSSVRSIVFDVIVKMKDRSYMIVAPTGSGKTFMAGWWTKIMMNTGKRVLFCVPTRSIAFAHEKTLSRFFPVGVVVGRSARNWVLEEGERDILQNMPVVISTYHKAFKILGVYDFDALVLDEFHTIRDNRFVEYLSLNTMPKLALSATIQRENAMNIASLLGMELVFLKKRPTNVYFVPVFPGQEIEIDGTKIRANVIDIVKALDGKVIVFVSSRSRTYSLAEELTKNGIPAQPHNGGMTDYIRKRIEREFIEKKEPRVLVATTTLAMGVSLPADHVIITISRFKKPYPVLDALGRVIDIKFRYEKVSKDMIIQMVGRAGRFADGKKHYAFYIGEDADRFSRQLYVPPLTTANITQRYLNELLLIEPDYKKTVSYILYPDDSLFLKVVQQNESLKLDEELKRRVIMSGLRLETAIGIMRMPRKVSFPVIAGIIANSLEAKQNSRIYGPKLQNILIARTLRELPDTEITGRFNVLDGDYYDAINFASHFAYGIYVITKRFYPLWIMIASGMKFKNAWKGYIGVSRNALNLFDETFNASTPDDISISKIQTMDERLFRNIFMIDRASVIARVIEMKAIYNSPLWRL